MSALTACLAQNTPWDRDRVAIYDSLQKREEALEAGRSDYLLNRFQLQGDSEKPSNLYPSLMKLLQTPNQSTLSIFYEQLLLCPQVDMLFKASSPLLLGILGEWLVRHAPDKQAVIGGIACLASSQEGKELIKELGSHDEFSLAAAKALECFPGNPEKDLWDLAKAAKGWGCVAVLKLLTKTQDPHIKRWMLQDAFKKAGLKKHPLAPTLALIFARTGELRKELQNEMCDEALLEGAGEILLILMGQGGEETLSYYEEAPDALLAYIQHLCRKEPPLKRTLLNQILFFLLYQKKKWIQPEYAEAKNLLLDALKKPDTKPIAFSVEHKPSCLAFHPTQSLVFIGDTTGQIDVFNLTDKERAGQLSNPKQPVLAIGFEASSIYSFSQEYSDDPTLVSQELNHPESYEEKTITEWNCETGERVYDGGACRALFLPGKATLVALSKAYNRPYKIHWATGQKSWQPPAFYSNDLYHDMCVSRNGKWISASFSCTRDYNSFYVCLRLWSALTCEEVCNPEPLPGLSSCPRKIVLQTFSPNSQRLLVSIDGQLSLWSISEERMKVIDQEVGFLNITAMEWSPVSNLIAFGQSEGFVCLWDLETKQILSQEKVHQSDIQQIVFSPDGSYLGVISKDLRVDIISVLNRKSHVVVFNFSGH